MSDFDGLPLRLWPLGGDVGLGSEFYQQVQGDLSGLNVRSPRQSLIPLFPHGLLDHVNLPPLRAPELQFFGSTVRIDPNPYVVGIATLIDCPNRADPPGDVVRLSLDFRRSHSSARPDHGPRRKGWENLN